MIYFLWQCLYVLKKTYNINDTLLNKLKIILVLMLNLEYYENLIEKTYRTLQYKND